MPCFCVFSDGGMGQWGAVLPTPSLALYRREIRLDVCVLFHAQSPKTTSSSQPLNLNGSFVRSWDIDSFLNNFFCLQLEEGQYKILVVRDQQSQLV